MHVNKTLQKDLFAICQNVHIKLNGCLEVSCLASSLTFLPCILEVHELRENTRCIDI